MRLGLLAKSFLGPGLKDTLCFSPFAGKAAMLNHPDNNEPLSRTNLHVGGVSSAMSEPVCSDGKPQALTLFHGRRSLPLGKISNSRFAQVTVTIELAAIEQHLAEDCGVLRG